MFDALRNDPRVGNVNLVARFPQIPPLNVGRLPRLILAT
jgi:hypothetical protein